MWSLFLIPVSDQVVKKEGRSVYYERKVCRQSSNSRLFTLARGDLWCPGQGKWILLWDNIYVYAWIHDSDPHTEASGSTGMKGI